MTFYTSILIALAASSQQPPLPSVPDTLLVIELPDGRRGGTGRIRGNGEHSAEQGVSLMLSYLNIASECGASFPMLSNNWTHRVHIVSWSTAKDRAVVACLKSRLPTHFNAGLAKPHFQMGFTMTDTTLFREFESAATDR